MEISPEGLDGVLLDGVIFRGRPKGETEAYFEIKQDSAVYNLLERAHKAGQDYERAVFDYLKIYATYKQNDSPRPLVEDVEAIFKGMQIAKTLTKADKFAIMLRDSAYEGSWDNMIQNLKQKVDEEPLFKPANGHNGKQDFETLQRLKQYEEDNNINLADYCIVL